MAFENINREYIRNHHFVCDGLTFPYDDSSARLTRSSALPASPEKKQAQLRKKMGSLLYEKLDGSHAKFEVACAISWETMRKYISGKRDITRDALAKLCIGMRLTVDEAQELFCIHGHSLEPENNLLDAIVVDVLKCKEKIDVFYEECEEFGLNTP